MKEEVDLDRLYTFLGCGDFIIYDVITDVTGSSVLQGSPARSGSSRTYEWNEKWAPSHTTQRWAGEIKKTSHNTPKNEINNEI